MLMEVEQEILIGVRGYAGGSTTSNYNKGVEGAAGGRLVLQLTQIMVYSEEAMVEVQTGLVILLLEM